MSRTSPSSIGVDSAPTDHPLATGAPALEKWRADRWATVGISLVIFYTLIRNVLVAAWRPFWFDELNTVIVAGQPTLGKVWYALRHAEDSAPLLYVLVEHLCARLIPRAEIAYRVPSVLAFACILWCLFVFIRTRSGPGVAFACAALPLFTQIYWRYSVEARSYECVVACTAIALVCYQRVDQERWVIGLAASLFAAGAFHYYGFFVLAPFFAAEFVQAIRTRAIRWGVWLAIASGFLPMAAAYPILRQIKQFYGAHFWGQPTWAVVWNMYGRTPFRASLIAMVVLAIMAVVTIFVPVWRRVDVHSELFSANEHVVAIVLIALPVLEYVGIKLVHGALTMRYALALILGVSIAVSYSLRFLGRWVVVPAIVAMLALIVGQEAFQWKNRLPLSGQLMSQTNSFEKLAAAAGHTDLPIVVSDGEAYTPLAYYASPDWRLRLVGLADPPSSVAYAGSDSVDRQMIALSCCFALRVYDFRVFASEYPSFLLYSDGADFDYWPRRLAADKYELQVLVADHNQKVYLVNRPTGATAALKDKEADDRGIHYGN
jgi:hypothetical protein